MSSRFSWFRLYPEARNDAKLRALDDSQHRVWFNLLCLAAEQGERGTIEGYDSTLLAIEASGGDETLLQATIDKLKTLRIVSIDDEGTICFVKFTERQYDHPSDTPKQTADRKRKQREQEKSRESHDNNSDSHHKSRDVTNSHDTYSDTENKQRINTPNGVCTQPAPENPKPPTRTATPTNGNRAPFFRGDDPRYQTQHFAAVCKATARGPDGISPDMKTRLAVAAVQLQEQGLTPEQVVEAGEQCPYETPPTPKQLTDNARAWLTSKPARRTETAGERNARAIIERRMQRAAAPQSG